MTVNSLPCLVWQDKQWQEYLRSYYSARFLELFGYALIGLGYEENDDWVYG